VEQILHSHQENKSFTKKKDLRTNQPDARNAEPRRKHLLKVGTTTDDNAKVLLDLFIFHFREGFSL
jgi:hypothetical protein